MITTMGIGRVDLADSYVFYLVVVELEDEHNLFSCLLHSIR